MSYVHMTLTAMALMKSLSLSGAPLHSKVRCRTHIYNLC